MRPFRFLLRRRRRPPHRFWYAGDEVLTPGGIPGVIEDWAYDTAALDAGEPGVTARVRTPAGLVRVPAADLREVTR